MILIWLGSFFLMVLGLNESQKALALFLSRWQQSILGKSFEVSLPRMLARMLGIVVLEASPQKSILSSLAVYNLRIFDKRASVLWMALSSVGAWWMLLLTILFLNFSGTMLLGVCALSLITFSKFRKLDQFLKILFWLGMFLLGSEMMIRNSMGLQSMIGDSDVAFWLADGRLATVLSLFVLSLLISFIIHFEFWALCLALALLLTSVLSFNGAIALFAGERCARGLLLYWHGRSLNQDCQRVGRQMGLGTALAAFLAMFGALIVKDAARLGASFGMAAGASRSLDYAAALVVFLLFQFVLQMLVGHFVAKQVVDEVQEPRYFPVHWLHSEILSATAVIWAQTKIAKRLQEIRYHILGLETLKADQVPEVMRSRLQNEEVELTQLLGQLRH